jgi:hypothetical protein
LLGDTAEAVVKIAPAQLEEAAGASVTIDGCAALEAEHCGDFERATPIDEGALDFGALGMLADRAFAAMHVGIGAVGDGRGRLDEFRLCGARHGGSL